MNVLMISPGYPSEMPLFTRALARVGANVIGIGDGPKDSLPDVAREALSAYVPVKLADEQGVIATVREIAAKSRIDRIVCSWEPFMILAAKLREALELPGMTVAETIPFRDKEVMKQRLDEAGIRTPRHASTTTVQGVRDSVAIVGYPLVVKPIAGAGSADTYRVNDDDELERILPLLRNVTEVSVEEFIEGDDFTFDTVCVDGEVCLYHMAFYRPRALIARNNEWVSPQTVSIRDVDDPHVANGVKMGFDVLKALDFKTGITHMEWYRKPDGEAVFGEIACRAPGAKLVDLHNYAGDCDLYAAWAEAECLGRCSQTVQRRYNSVSIFKRAEGQGRIQSIEGLEPLLAEIAPHVCVLDLLPVGATRRNWKQTLISDGTVILRHPDLQRTLEMADKVGTNLRLRAG